MTDPPVSSANSSPLTARVMWVIVMVLAIGILSLATSALPGRARPLFLLPLAFGVVSTGLAVALRRSLGVPCSVTTWLLTTALALGGYGQVVISSFHHFQALSPSNSETDPQALIAIQLLKGTEYDGLANQMEQELEAQRNGWDRFLTFRYAAFGTLTPRTATVGLVLEAVLVIVGVAIGRRLLDAKRSACQAGPT